MKTRFVATLISVRVLAVAAIAAGSLCVPGLPVSPEQTDNASTRTETAPIVLAQFNPCPNGKCR